MMQARFQKSIGNLTLDAVLQAAPGRVTALFGHSGAGKTTLIDCLAGLSRPDHGCITLNGQVFFDSEKGFNRAVRERRVGYVFQEPRLFPHLSVERNLKFGSGRLRRHLGNRQIGFTPLVELLGIQALLKRLPHTLSGGERQRVAIGRALLSDPDLLLLDEPVSAVDQTRSSEILDFLQVLKAQLNIPIILVTHRMDDLLRVADDLAVLDGGKVIAAGPLATVAAQPGFQNLLADETAGSVFAVTVGNHDPRDHLSRLQFASGSLTVPLLNMPIGSRLHVRIKTTDIAIAKERPKNISMLNILPAKIARMTTHSGGYVSLQLQLEGGDVLWARITKRSSRDLALTENSGVFAMIKAVALAAPSIITAT